MKNKRVSANKTALALVAQAIFDEFTDGDLLEGNADWAKEVTIPAGVARKIVEAFANSAGQHGKLGMAMHHSTNNDSDRVEKIMGPMRKAAEEVVKLAYPKGVLR